MTTYRIVRMFARSDMPSRTIKRGLTLKEARAHCRDPETSSRTCTSQSGKRLTSEAGQWFDGYEEE